MTFGQKIFVSLFVSVLVCAGAVFLGLPEIAAVNFYRPAATEIKEQMLEEIASAQNEYFSVLIRQFDAFLMDGSVRTYTEARPDGFSVKEREMARSELFAKIKSLQGIRIVDDDGIHVHFSSFRDDIIKKNSGFAYRNYNATGEVAFSSVRYSDWIPQNASPAEKCRVIKDGDADRFIFSMPFFDKSEQFRGTALFYCAAGQLNQFLYDKNLIGADAFGLLVTGSRDEKNMLDGFGGFVLGLPKYGAKTVRNQILEAWKEDGSAEFWRFVPETNAENDSVRLDHTGSEQKNASFLRVLNRIVLFGRRIFDANPDGAFCVFSHKNDRSDFGFVALVYDESELQFPAYIRVGLAATVFAVFFLFVFLILHFHRGPNGRRKQHSVAHNDDRPTRISDIEAGAVVATKMCIHENPHDRVPAPSDMPEMRADSDKESFENHDGCGVDEIVERRGFFDADCGTDVSENQRAGSFGASEAESSHTDKSDSGEDFYGNTEAGTAFSVPETHHEAFVNDDDDEELELLFEAPPDFVLSDTEPEKLDGQSEIKKTADAAGRDAAGIRRTEHFDMEKVNKECGNGTNLDDSIELEALDSQEETMPFTFTQQFTAKDTAGELSSAFPDSIVQNSDGTFCVARSDSNDSEAPLDSEFKKLVDSVLR